MNYSPTALATTGTSAIGLLQFGLSAFVIGAAACAAAALWPRKDKS